MTMVVVKSAVDQRHKVCDLNFFKIQLPIFVFLPIIASATISLGCEVGISSSCDINPAYESWPGIGIWQQSADGGLGGSCNSCK